jgi:hypothetical protein
VLVRLFAVLVGRRGVPLGLVVLAVGVVVGGLVVVVRGGVVPRRGLVVVLHRRVLVLVGHGMVLRSGGRAGAGGVEPNASAREDAAATGLGPGWCNRCTPATESPVGRGGHSEPRPVTGRNRPPHAAAR